MLFDKKIEPSCEYCISGKNLGENEFICKKKGVVTIPYHCSGFRYDPLKRQPEIKKQVKISEMDPEDFSL